MLTPQEVSEKAFLKAAFGGYNMTQVDEFLDVLTADYGVLYTENAVLKSKMKVMVDKVEEYRSTEEAMRKALMSAQRMADETIREAEEQRHAILAEAEQLALAKVSAIREERAMEEQRLVDIQRTVIEFSAQARATYQHNIEYLESLQQCIPAPIPVEEPAAPAVEEDEVMEDIDQNVQRILEQAMADVAASKETPSEEIAQDEAEPEDEDLDCADLAFGENY